jgi:glycosyltransferase involved in cell wall biosynthesis
LEGLDVKAIVHGRGYNFKGLAIPPNVEVGEMVPQHEYYQLIYHSLFEVVPLQPALHPGGGSQVVQAMMMGKAVVATRTAALTEYVEHGVTGLLVEPQNVAEMRAAISFLLEHPRDATRMGAAARRRFEECYTFESFARRVHHLLRQVHANAA